MRDITNLSIYDEGYINSSQDTLTKFTSSSTQFKDILPLNISLMTTKTVLITTRIALSYVMKWNIPLV